MANEKYEIEVSAPLLRPGITIRCWVSKNYVAQTTKDLLDTVREINKPPELLYINVASALRGH